MKLTTNDGAFLSVLSELLRKNVLRVGFKEDGLKRFVLRQNYGSRVTDKFGVTRQGVRWRFQRLMDMYVSAYETILFVESNLGPELRSQAMAIAKQRAELRQKAQKTAEMCICRR